MITAPNVIMVTASELSPEIAGIVSIDEETTAAEAAGMFGGRACYQSWKKAYPPTARDADYIESTVHASAHYSVIEHAHVAFYVTGVSRSLTHELIRHRQFGYSQLSQRYVPSEDMDWVCPPEYQDEAHEMQRWEVQDAFSAAVRAYDQLVRDELATLEAKGITGTEARKRARQAARSVLPNCTETKLVISGNHRAWLEAMGKRWAPGADPEIRTLFGHHILPRLREIAPAIYRHVPEDYRLTGITEISAINRVRDSYGQVYSQQDTSIDSSTGLVTLTYMPVELDAL